MRKKRSKDAIIIFLIFIFIIILISMYYISQNQDLEIQEDLIFFQLWNSKKEDLKTKNLTIEHTSRNLINKKTNQYKVKVSKNYTNHKKVNLVQTIDTNTLVNEKIAPGTKGNFDIILTSEDTLNYKIKLNGKNEKPKNFEIYIEKEKGTIEKNETIKIPVNWQWKYETNLNENKQDTKDGETIKKYNFEICVIGE